MVIRRGAGVFGNLLLIFQRRERNKVDEILTRQKCRSQKKTPHLRVHRHFLLLYVRHRKGERQIDKQRKRNGEKGECLILKRRENAVEVKFYVQLKFGLNYTEDGANRSYEHTDIHAYIHTDVHTDIHSDIHTVIHTLAHNISTTLIFCTVMILLLPTISTCSPYLFKRNKRNL